MVWKTSGSTSGMARNVSVNSTVSSAQFGMMLAQCPARTCAMTAFTESVSMSGFGSMPMRRRTAVNDTAALHIARKQAERRVTGLRPRDAIRAAKRSVGGRQQQIFLAINRNRAHFSDRLVAQVSNASIDFALLKHVEQHV